MIVTHLNEGLKAALALSGGVLTIDGKVSIDLVARQKDMQQVIDVCLDNKLDTIREGLGAWYVATVIIPPRQYELVQDEESEEDGGKLVPRELDITTVEVRLYTLPAAYLEGGQVPANVDFDETEETN